MNIQYSQPPGRATPSHLLQADHYSDACVEALTIAQTVLESANQYAAAKNMADMRPQHPISIKNFAASAERHEGGEMADQPPARPPRVVRATRCDGLINEYRMLPRRPARAKTIWVAAPHRIQVRSLLPAWTARVDHERALTCSDRGFSTPQATCLESYASTGSTIRRCERWRDSRNRLDRSWSPSSRPARKRAPIQRLPRYRQVKVPPDCEGDNQWKQEVETTAK
jgi:hypothetical protein